MDTMDNLLIIHNVLNYITCYPRLVHRFSTGKKVDIHNRHEEENKVK